jgi:hypothetical protein
MKRPPLVVGGTCYLRLADSRAAAAGEGRGGVELLWISAQVDPKSTHAAERAEAAAVTTNELELSRVDGKTQ